MTIYLFTSALRDLIRISRLIIWLIVCALIGLMAFGYMRVMPDVKASDAYPTLSGMLAFRLLPLAAAIFASTVVAQEVEQRTIVYMLTRPIPRSAIILTRTLAAALVVMAITFLGTTAVSVATYGTHFLSNEFYRRDLLAIPIGSLAYTSLFSFICLLLNKSMIVNLGIAFVWETALPNLQGNAYLLSVASYLKAIAERPESESAKILNFLAGALGQNTLTKQQSWLTLIVLTLVMLFAAQFWFTRFEYVPREDAE